MLSYNAYTPIETAELVARAGVIKANTRLDKTFFSSVSAGCLLSFACATALSTNAAPWYQENAPGLIRTISALVFPYGLCMIVLTGADLCTGSFMVSSGLCLDTSVCFGRASGDEGDPRSGEIDKASVKEWTW